MAREREDKKAKALRDAKAAKVAQAKTAAAAAAIEAASKPGTPGANGDASPAPAPAAPGLKKSSSLVKSKSSSSLLPPPVGAKGAAKPSPGPGFLQSGNSKGQNAQPPAFVNQSSRLQQRLAGPDNARREHIAQLRAEAKKKREALAAAGGFDLLAQGTEMSAFEQPFLRDWVSHQELAFQGKVEGRPFPFYRGKGPHKASMQQQEEDAWAEEEGAVEESAQPAPLPHPWTFGAAFVFAGATA